MKKALIIYGGWEGHSPRATSEIAAQILREAGFEYELSDSLESLNDLEKVKGYDLIVPNWTMGQIRKEQAFHLSQAVLSGVGVAGFHGGAGDAFRENTEFQFMIGGQFVAHPDNHKDYMVNIVLKDDPIVAGVSDFPIHSEQYYLHVDPANEVLATTTFQTVSAPYLNGTVMPVAWKRRHGQGKVFYLSIGHGPAEFEVPELREILKHGCMWAAR